MVMCEGYIGFWEDQYEVESGSIEEHPLFGRTNGYTSVKGAVFKLHIMLRR